MRIGQQHENWYRTMLALPKGPLPPALIETHLRVEALYSRLHCGEMTVQMMAIVAVLCDADGGTISKAPAAAGAAAEGYTPPETGAPTPAEKMRMWREMEHGTPIEVLANGTRKPGVFNGVFDAVNGLVNVAYDSGGKATIHVRDLRLVDADAALALDDDG